MSELLSLKDFITPDATNKDFCRREYARYKKLTPEQRHKIELLRQFVGKEILYKFRGRNIVMQVMAVSMSLSEKVDNRYSSWPYQFRLNYTDGKFREHEGFWTMNIDNVLGVDCLTGLELLIPTLTE